MRLLILLSIAGCASMEPRPYCSPGPDGRICFQTEAERSADWERKHPPPQLAPRVAVEVAARQEAAAADERAEKAARDEHEAALQRHYEAEQARQQAAREREARAADHASQARWAVPVVSALICQRREALEGLKGDAAREARLTVGSGVKDLRALREIATGRDDNQQAIKALNAALERFGVAPVACAGVAELETCRLQGDACPEGETRDAADVWRWHARDFLP